MSNTTLGVFDSMIVVYGCLVGPISILSLSTVALFHA